jgi:periplasmic copper chaperone A
MSKSFSAILRAAGLGTAGVLYAVCAFAQPATVTRAWVRASVPGQQGTGAFMQIAAPSGAQLVGASSPVAGIAEVHEMKLEGDVMRMRAIPVLDLPAGRTVELKPGGYHLMLQDLKKPLAAGTVVPLTLVFKDAKGVESRVTVEAPVAAAAPAGHMEHMH